ncbi:unnamed protein product [Amoebophrya sp. A120]|nr:unnamed protein product [Amoebophrya sp. A120]|eukprot:GSA120T00025758001.1
MAFFGLKVKPGKPVAVEDPLSPMLFLSRVTVPADMQKGQKATLKIISAQDKQNPSGFAVAVLKPGFESAAVNLYVDPMETKFVADGPVALDLTGYYAPDQGDDDDESMESMDLDEEKATQGEESSDKDKKRAEDKKFCRDVEKRSHLVPPSDSELEKTVAMLNDRAAVSAGAAKKDQQPASESADKKNVTSTTPVEKKSEQVSPAAAKPKIEAVELQNDVPSAAPATEEQKKTEDKKNAGAKPTTTSADKNEKEVAKPAAKETVESDLEDMSTDEEEELYEEEDFDPDEEIIALVREAKSRGLQINPALLANYEEALRRTGEEDMELAPPTKKQKPAAEQGAKTVAPPQGNKSNQNKQTNVKVNKK